MMRPLDEDRCVPTDRSKKSTEGGEMNITEIAPNIHRIAIPLPKTPLKATNSYFIQGDARDLLIDTAFNHPLSSGALDQAVKTLAIDMARTDLFITHLHSDHAGLSQHLVKPGIRILMSAPDGNIVGQGRNSDFWTSFTDFYHCTGLFAGGHVTEVDQHPGYAYSPPPAPKSPAPGCITFVDDGFTINVGSYRFTAVHTPGHTRGHLCLYEPDRRLLFSGDHILGKITPNITQMSFDHPALGEYLHSLDAVSRLDIDTVHPGHRHSIDNCRGRIDELKRHHQSRLEEVLEIIGDRRLNTVDVARQMRWSLTLDNWDEYPPAQKLFSAGEALAHLYHLELAGTLVRENDENGVMLFRKG